MGPLYKSPFGWGFIQRSEYTPGCWWVFSHVGRPWEFIAGRMAEYLGWLESIGVLKETWLRIW